VVAWMLGGERRVQGCCSGSGWTWSSPKFGMGNNSVPALKVFEVMPERKLFLKFAILFAGL
jgi:hypothetical protein